MSGSELAARVRESLDADREAFAARVESEVEDLKREVEQGTFDNSQAIVGLEYEFYAVDAETDALKRVPRRLLEYIGFEKELGLHNAEMQTSPQPCSAYGLRATEREVQAKLEAAQDACEPEGMVLVSDGMWTVPPVGETAGSYLADSIEEDGVVLATNMSDAVRYHAMANTGFKEDMSLDAPHVHLDARTVMPESLITSIQPHYQMSQAADLPERFRYALRVAGPLVALAVNSPFFPPDLYDTDDAQEILTGCAMENRVTVFESVLNPDGADPKVTFPRDVEHIDEVIDRIAADRTVVPMLQEDAGRFDDRFAHFRHKHGTYWRWVRPVLDGPSRAGANARIEFRPLPAQPTVRDSMAFLAVFAGLMESLPRREHPLRSLPWEDARDNFYAAVADGLEADLTWVTLEGTETTDAAVLFEELFDAARDGLELRGLSDEDVERYVRPLEARWEAGLTPARWKHREVARRVNHGVPLAQAIWGMQADYIDWQRETLIQGCFTEWIDG
ncbi:hypothetical protein [Haloglomus litoreum]|uniref:hypothetical protein n=1 Tax=Haloglomus litoreum TaxID=3034026 RepID=UPI0023E79966|nr:hypothetical protein [Haloglomus sp. DT116]